jgi:quercetin dioxygenase-like cupin family protein/chorismate mutase
MTNTRSLVAASTGLALLMPLAWAETTPSNPHTSQDISARNVLDTGSDILGRPVQYPTGEAQILGSEIFIPAGLSTPLHFHPVPLLAYVQSGSIRVVYEGSDERIYRAGDSFVEAINVVHQGFGLPPEGARLISFDLRSATLPSTVVLETHASADHPAPLVILKALMWQRLQIMEAVAAEKVRLGLPVEVPEREAEVIADFIALSAAFDIPASQAEHFIHMQIEAAKTLQRALIARGTSQAPETGPSLGQHLRPMLDQLNPVLASTFKRVLDDPSDQTPPTSSFRPPSSDPAMLQAWSQAITGLPGPTP